MCGHNSEQHRGPVRHAWLGDLLKRMVEAIELEPSGILLNECSLLYFCL